MAPELLKTQFPAARDAIEGVVRSTGRWEGELIQTRKDGRRVIVSCRWALQEQPPAEPGILEVNRDITARRQGQQGFRSIFESGPIGIALVDHELNLFDSNPAFDELFGAAEERSSGFLGLTEPDGRAGLEESFADVAGGRERAAREHRCVRRDGAPFWARVTLSCVRNVDGDVRFYIAMVEDADERHRVEAALREHGERMEALEHDKSEFLNLASHELRGPLTLIRGYLSMMDEGYLGELNDRGRQVLPALLAKADAMNMLVEQMLATARVDDRRLLLNFERHDLREEMQRAVAAIGPLATDSHRVVLELPLEAVPVLVDAGCLRTILANVLDNAIKYSPGGGEVLCRVTRLGDAAVASVSDRGLGISRREMHRLFTRFGRVVTPETSAIGGTGLGLFLSQELAHRLGGEITAAARSGGGTVFSLTLPLQRDEAGRSAD